jgi:3-methyladenine DNA glycosylase AlkD
MQTYVLALKKLLEMHANRAQAAPMKKYMRGQFEYLGIKSPKMTELLREYIGSQGLPALEELDLIERELWSLREREFQYAAMSLLGKFEKKLEPEFIIPIEYMITTKSWWDTVDSLAGHAVGTHFKRFPDVRRRYLKKWRNSDNFWLRRTVLLFQLGYKKETDFKLLCEIIHENLGSDEFFINKAIGWALRQYAWTDPKAVKKFVKGTDLHPLSRREALKNIEKSSK